MGKGRASDQRFAGIRPPCAGSVRAGTADRYVTPYTFLNRTDYAEATDICFKAGNAPKAAEEKLMPLADALKSDTALDSVPERIGAGKAAAICGFTPKTMRKLAKDGKIPGAAFLGNNWRFDERRLRDWIRRQEAACLSVEGTTSLNGAGSGTPASKFAGATCDEAYEHLLAPKRRSACLPS